MTLRKETNRESVNDFLRVVNAIIVHRGTVVDEVVRKIRKSIVMRIVGPGTLIVLDGNSKM